MPLERCAEGTCTGCGACAAICPKAAIALTPGEGGFSYPRVDPARCVGCGACDHVCPLGAEAALRRSARRAVAAWDLGEGRAASTSGGAFGAIARAVIAGGGAVCAVALELSEGRVRHTIVEDEAGLARVRRSKYLQSETAPALREALGLLRKGRRVLFVGTPCQVAGWRRLTVPFGDRAPACDLVCGGVPSSALFAAYLREEERRAGAPIRDYDFRDKSAGWNFPRVRLAFANGKTRRLPLRMDPFYAAFAAKLSCRLSCANCPYSCSERVGDITIADCWHVAAYRSDYDDNRGTSLLLTQTQEGERLLTAAQAAGETWGLNVLPYDIAHAVRSNAPLRHPLGADGNRSRFLADVLVGGKSLRTATRAYLGRGWFVRAWVRWWMKRLLWVWLRRRG